MTDLTKYINSETSKAMAEVGAFFANTVEEYRRQKIEGVKYARVATGLICPSAKVASFNRLLSNVDVPNPIAQAVQSGCGAIIKRELYNRDSFWSGEIDDAVCGLAKYGFTTDEVAAVYNSESDFLG